MRDRQKRNFLTTLFLSQGVPMLTAGDELGRTQHGNNNAYCHDNELSWINWDNIDTGLLQFTRKIIHFFKTHPAFSRKKWFKGLPIKGVGLEDIAWFSVEGLEMKEENWQLDHARSLGVYINGKAIRSVDQKGKPIVDDSFYIIFNAHSESLPFKLPPPKFTKEWMKIIDTDLNLLEQKGDIYKSGEEIIVQGRSVVVLQHPEKK
jgi:glycogen operon protein